MDQVKEEQEHAQKLINYVNQRGGRVSFEALESPTAQDWTTASCVLKDALKLEDKVTEVSRPALFLIFEVIPIRIFFGTENFTSPQNSRRV